ncbi:M23 family metallopeptidase [Candidatus Uhrbacteria bacterium]|nr:M23 family metallopeptidase [Candidatus Uhrbacteria bacterium]
MAERRLVLLVLVMLFVLGVPISAFAQQTAGEIGMDLRLPFRSDNAYLVTQTYCPNDLDPDGNACFSHKNYYHVAGLDNDNYAIDFAGGSPYDVLATADGTVIEKGPYGGWGNQIRIEHPNGCISRYGHMSSFASGVNIGTSVSQGQKIGVEGNTGSSTGIHIHFSLHCPVPGSNPTYYDPVIPEPISGYTDFIRVISNSCHQLDPQKAPREGAFLFLSWSGFGD